ncbi:RhaT family transporter [Marinibacterium profundimaris]|uniref:RhaT family transporter n=1 Tax=Marinibacterium profundimaris TaxID=1679460 RepID=A0A225NP37_9RHOB|nr:RhaT family transporter [Marinibacterium profundimaris]
MPHQASPAVPAAPVPQRNTVGLGIGLMIGSTIVFALQDGMSRHLAAEYNTLMVVMIRYWFFAAFVIAIAARAKGGLRRAVKTSQPVVQALRGLLLAAEVCVAVYGFTLLGLIESQAVFICYPLLVAALSGPVLGESVGWRRWSAIGVGFIGVMFILKPSGGVFDIAAAIPLAAALMFALYSLLTRYAARRDTTATSFFWTGAVGAVFMTAVGIWHWEPMTLPDYGWMACLCVTGALGHWLLIKCYEVAEASAVQPFAYFHFVWASILGMTLFAEVLRPSVATGAALIVAAGLFTLWRERAKRAA